MDIFTFSLTIYFLVRRLQKAISASTSSSSWFTFGSSQPFSRKEVSLTEQFIRFLEQGSVDNTKSMLALPPIEVSLNLFLTKIFFYLIEHSE